MVEMVTNGDTGRQLAEHGLTSVETISSNRPRPNFSGWVRRDTARQLDEFAAALVVARRRWTAKVNGEPDRPVGAAASLSRWSSPSCRAAAGQLAPTWLCVAGIEQTPH